MDLPSTSYFYALAALSMAFVGFTSIVVVLYQGTGRPLSKFHILLTRLFVELGLMATAFAMLAPTLSLFHVEAEMVWRLSSAVMLGILVPWLATYPWRRKIAAPERHLPLRWYVMTAVGAGACGLLVLNAAAWGVQPGPAPLAIATVFVLSYATVSYLGTYALFTQGKAPTGE